jgi:hypothetical protein
MYFCSRRSMQRPEYSQERASRQKGKWLGSTHQKVPGEWTEGMSYSYSTHSPGLMSAKMLSPRKQTVPSAGGGLQGAPSVPGRP